ncbi:MAG: F420-dependent protein [Pseudonocardia sp.]|nr:F420-dependent protein [Pseudonocardia sp.]
MPTLDDPQELRRRITAAPVARLATLRSDGRPRLVPVTFALVDDLICFVVDEVKPKRDMRLARLADIARDDRVASRRCSGRAGRRPEATAAKHTLDRWRWARPPR